MPNSQRYELNPYIVEPLSNLQSNFTLEPQPVQEDPEIQITEQFANLKIDGSSNSSLKIRNKVIKKTKVRKEKPKVTEKLGQGGKRQAQKAEHVRATIRIK